MTELIIKKPHKNDLDAEVLLSRVINAEQCVPAMRQMNVLWPHTESMCRHLCEYITHAIPEPGGEKPLINHCMAKARTVIVDSLTRWRAKEITDVAVFNELKTILVETAALVTYWKVSLKNDTDTTWSPLSNQCMLEWWEKNQSALSITTNTKINNINKKELFQRIESLLIKDFVEDQLKVKKASSHYA